ncbi:MAG: hypothetical protein WEB04_08540 [Dehalococcoidia bacterium]
MIRKALELTALVLIVGGLGIGAYSRADAQYPQPTGSVVLGVSDGLAAAGQEVVVTATAVDTNGDAVAGASCTFSIGEQPGTDASVEAGPFVTDSAGLVSTTLNAGSTEGDVVVQATCVPAGCEEGACELLAAATVVVGAAESPAAPPASLPDTGTGSGDGGNGLLAWAFLAVGASTVLTALAVRFRRRLTR